MTAKETKESPGESKAEKHTWFTAGLTLADASKVSISATPKLLIPILLQQMKALSIREMTYDERGITMGNMARRDALRQPVAPYFLHLCPCSWDIRNSEAREVDEV